MVVNDYAGILIPRGALESIASKLAPAVGQPLSDQLTGRRRPGALHPQHLAQHAVEHGLLLFVALVVLSGARELI